MRAALFKKNLTGPEGLRAQLLAVPALPEETRKKAKKMGKDELVAEIMHFHIEKTKTASLNKLFSPAS